MREEDDIMIKKLFASLLVAMFAVLVMAATVLAEEAEELVVEDNVTRIHYSMAVRGAIRNLPALTGMDDAISDLEEMRTSLQNWREHRRRDDRSTPEELMELDRQIGDIGAQISRMRISQEMLRTSTEFFMRDSMTSIANTNLDIQLMEAGLAHERVILQNARLRLNAGLISESAYNIAQLEVQQMESELAAARVSLVTEQQNLNRNLQRSITGNYYVAVEKELMPLPANLNDHVRRNAHRQPNVRQRDITVNRARASLREVFYAFGTPERAEQERTYNQAQRERTETLRATETAIRNQYNSLQALLHQNASLEIDLQRANERLEVTRLNHQAGLATLFNIQEAELAILRIEIALERNMNNYWHMQFILENPFLLVN